MRDHAAQRQVTRDSGLRWTISGPVNVVDEDRPEVFIDAAMRTVSMNVGRDQVARQVARQATVDYDVGTALALSS